LATVIDSLLIELGLDSSKFDKAQKKSVEELRKFDEANQKSQKNLQQNAKKSAEGFEKARDALISFGTAAFSVGGFVSFVNTMTAGNAALSRNANLFSLSAKELDAWGGVLKSVGGNADEFQATLQNLQSGVAGIKLGNAAMLTPLARLGALGSVDINKGTVDIYKLSDALNEFRKVNGEQLTYTLAQQLGIDKNTFMIMEQGSDSVRKLFNESYKLSGVNDKNTESAKKFQAELGNLSNAFGGAKNSVMDGLYPTLITLAHGIEYVVSMYAKLSNAIDKFESKIGMSDRAKSLSRVSPILGAALGVYDKLTGYKEPVNPATTGTAATGSARSQRNKNPGNIKYGEWAKNHGATGQDSGGFAIFPDNETGQAALDDLLENQYYNKGQKSIASIIGGINGKHAYSTTDQASYIDYLSKKLGVNPNQELDLAQLHRVGQEIPGFESGMTGAKANAPMNSGVTNNNVQTSINTINVQTNATDANGIALGINKAIQNNSLINAGVVGNR